MKKILVAFVIVFVLIAAGGLALLFGSDIERVNYTKGSVEKYTLFGKMIAEREFNKQDQPDGTTKLFYLDGDLKREIQYRSGILHGISKFYDKEGILKSEDHYSNGKKILHREYDAAGNLLREEK